RFGSHIKRDRPLRTNMNKNKAKTKTSKSEKPTPVAPGVGEQKPSGSSKPQERSSSGERQHPRQVKQLPVEWQSTYALCATSAWVGSGSGSGSGTVSYTVDDNTSTTSRS